MPSPEKPARKIPRRRTACPYRGGTSRRSAPRIPDLTGPSLYRILALSLCPTPIPSPCLTDHRAPPLFRPRLMHVPILPRPQFANMAAKIHRTVLPLRPQRPHLVVQSSHLCREIQQPIRGKDLSDCRPTLLHLPACRDQRGFAGLSRSVSADQFAGKRVEPRMRTSYRSIALPGFLLKELKVWRLACPPESP